MRRVYSVLCYGLFLAVFAYGVAFVENWDVPSTIDRGGSLDYAWIVDLAVLLLFAIQHSGMARRTFKRHVPPSIERSTYVLASTICLALVFYAWRPIPHIVWSLDSRALEIVSLFGFAWTVVATFLLNHFELFGLAPATGTTFRTPLLYKLVRHPIYVGFIIAFTSAATMTVGHLLFSGFMIAYVLVGYRLEERDLVRVLGGEYEAYRSRVNALIPWRRKTRQ
ncbi:MAG: NnrU family protein [Kofleriaceae bacterium]